MSELKYHQVINKFVKDNSFTSYIELGLRDPNSTFNHVICERKESVDLVSCGATHTMSTDEYFAGPGADDSFDIYLHDASHYHDIVRVDVKNIFARWKDNSILVIDDVNPEELWLLDEQWCGTAWQVWAELRQRDDLEMHIFRGTRFGYIKKGKQIPFTKTIIPTFEFLEENREELMNFIDFDENSRF